MKNSKDKKCNPPNGAMRGSGKRYMAEGGAIDETKARRMGDLAQGRKLKADTTLLDAPGRAVAAVAGKIRGNPQGRKIDDSADTMARNRRNYKK